MATETPCFQIANPDRFEELWIAFALRVYKQIPMDFTVMVRHEQTRGSRTKSPCLLVWFTQKKRMGIVTIYLNRARL